MKTNTHKIFLKLNCIFSLKTLFVIIIFTLFSFTIILDKKPFSKVISNYLNLNINVKTNVDCFTCNFHSEYEDTLGVAVNSGNSGYSIEGGQYLIPVMLIDCHNGIMNNDLQTMFKASVYPQIMIKINNLSFNKDSGNKGTGLLSVDIDGTDKNYPIIFTNYINNNIMAINGTIAIDLNDFSINPPSKFFGLVTVDKVITINFGLKLKLLQI